MPMGHETRAGCTSDKLCVGQMTYCIYLNAIQGVSLNQVFKYVKASEIRV